MADQPSVPTSLLDFAKLISWLDRLAAEYDARTTNTDLAPELRVARQQLERTRVALLNPYAYLHELDDLRRLIASGFLIYRVPELDSQSEVPPLLFQQFVCAALWPLIIIRPLQLSAFWGRTARIIMSAELIDLIINMQRHYYRSHDRNDRSAIAQRLTKALAEPQYAEGIRNLLEDMRDPMGGGVILSALATMRDGAPPPPMLDIPALIKWVLLGALGGVIGNRTDALVVKAWESLSLTTQTASEQSETVTNEQVSELEYKINWLLMKMRPVEAVVIGDQLVMSEPHNYRAWLLRSIARRQIRDLKGALADNERAIDINPNSANNYVHRAKIYENLGDLDKAVKDANRALQIDPNNEYAKAILEEISQLRAQGKRKSEIALGLAVSPGLKATLMEKFGK